MTHRTHCRPCSSGCEAVSERSGEEGFKGHIQINTSQENGEVVVRIKDNGPGISTEIKDQLFEPFVTTKPSGKGNVGLGLSIAYDIRKMGLI